MAFKVLMGFGSLVLLLVYGESSYSGVSDREIHYHEQVRQLGSIKSSFLLRNGISPSNYDAPVTSTSRVYHVTAYGADPTGKSDSTNALQRAIFDAFQAPTEGFLLAGVADLGGTEVHLDGGTYKISRPLRFPATSGGNLMIHSGSLCASLDFPTGRHLIELWPSTFSVAFEAIKLKDLMLDCNFRGGGISVINSIRTTIDNCYISHFKTDGILIQGGHETFIRNSFIGQHITAGGDRLERDFSGIGINVMGNDNAITDVVIFSALIGVLISGQANTLTGVHCYNKATGWGGTGIYIRVPGLTQTRILNCYLDYTGIVAEDPVQLLISGSFFLGNAFVVIKSIKGVVRGVSIVDNMFSGDGRLVDIVQLDQSNGRFTTIDQVIVDRNNVRGMTLKSTVARGSTWGNGSRWIVDFSRVLLFPNIIKHVQYTLHAGSSFPNHVLRNISANRVVVESDRPVSATLYLTVDQSGVGI